MLERDDISRVRNLLRDNIGKKVKLTAKKGRKRVVVRHGIIKNVYPQIFTVQLDNLSEFAEVERTASFSYSDILIRSIELTIVENKTEIK